MTMRDLTVVTSPDTGKGRSFRGSLLCYSTSPALWPQGAHKNVRPIFAMVACSQAESIPFVRNLQSGRQATMHDGREKQTFECLKSADYEFRPFVAPEGVVWTIYLPALWRIDPGMVDPEAVSFATPGKWLAPEDADLALWLLSLYPHGETWRAAEQTAERLEVLRYVTRVAARFCERLDPRTRCPLIPDARFYALVLAALLNDGQATMAGENTYGSKKWAHGAFSYAETDLDSVGLLPGIATSTTHARLEATLAECVRVYESGAVVRRAA